ncbi:MAG: NUDIX domain-containing protein [Solobacterium sp.]|nr:NUDIX domain-containing protein [Solobacterium sp.]
MREKSCGAVIYRMNEDKRFEYLLVRSMEGEWGFAKGHVRPGESEKETAAREILEETGLETDFVGTFRETCSYMLPSGNNKDVVYFLAVPHGGSLRPHEGEIIEVGWFRRRDAAALLAHDSQKAILRKAVETIRAMYED